MIMLKFSAVFLDIDEQINAKQQEVDFLNDEVSVWLAKLQLLQDTIRSQEQELAKYLVIIDPSLLSTQSYVADKLLLEPIVVIANCDVQATRGQKLVAAQNAVFELKMQLKQLQDKFTKAEKQSLSLEIDLVASASTLILSEMDSLKASRNPKL
jgi:hypothetical protein